MNCCDLLRTLCEEETIRSDRLTKILKLKENILGKISQIARFQIFYWTLKTFLYDKYWIKTNLNIVAFNKKWLLGNFHIKNRVRIEIIQNLNHIRFEEVH